MSGLNEYLSDKLAFDSDDEKIIYRAKRSAERKINEEEEATSYPF